ncbi:MAG: D-aminoacyl-tRNA deacylase [Acidaminococcaceae bacterium]|nr:D-aminoacyl-tRNA deacylase [Acidaminococcaceae bacterium]
MRAVVQRVSKADVSVNGSVCGRIERGLLVLLGVAAGDTDKDLDYVVDKITGLRIFEDELGKMNLSVSDVGGAILAVSQFTVCGDCRKGKRPSFDTAASPELAEVFYDRFVENCRNRGISVATGIFRAHMSVSLINDGPVTILLDSRKEF